VRVEEAVDIDQPPEAVWAVVSDPRNDPRWCAKVESVEVSGERRWRAIHKPVPLRPPLDLSAEQLAADPPRQMRLREEDQTSVFNVEYRLQPTANGTRFTQVSEFEWKKLPRFLHGFFGRGVRRDVRGQLRQLKKLLEA
jgi:uncharacterized protein YndB with AHSA1/START domain